MSVLDREIEDVRVPAAPGSLMRAVQLWDVGRFRVSRRDAELYSVQITSAGAWGRIWVYDGTGRKVFHMPSTFPGSFWLSGGCKDGIIVYLDSLDMAPTVTVNFREKDTQDV